MPCQTRNIAFLLGSLILACLVSPAYGESAASLIEDGNRLFSSGSFDEALAAYENASVEAPEAAEIFFNKGAARYRKEEFTESAKLFESAALKTKDRKLEALSKFNQGNCFFKESERQQDSDLQKSLEALKTSILHYQQALKINPELSDAAHNLEVARLTVKNLLDQINKQKEEEKRKQEEQQKNKEDLEKLIKQQEQLNKETKEVGKQKDKESSCNSLAKDQESIRDETGSLAKRLEVPKPTPQQAPQQAPQSAAKENLEEAQNSQQKAEEQLQEQNLEEASSAQEEALQKLKEALDSLGNKEKQEGGEQKQEKQQQQREQQSPSPKKPQENTNGGQQEQKNASPPKNEKAHNILEEEQENREKRRISTSRGFRPTEKDW